MLFAAPYRDGALCVPLNSYTFRFSQYPETTSGFIPSTKTYSDRISNQLIKLQLYGKSSLKTLHIIAHSCSVLVFTQINYVDLGLADQTAQLHTVVDVDDEVVDNIYFPCERYSQSNMKIFTPVEFPLEDLDMGEFMNSINSPRESFSTGDNIYDLMGCVCHDGG